MNGIIQKVSAFLFALISSLTFAANVENTTNNAMIYNAKSGCMSCHQKESMRSDTVSKECYDKSCSRKHSKKTRMKTD